MQPIRIIEIPDCKMVFSGECTFGDAQFDRFFEWFSSQPQSIFPRDFMFMNETGFHWLYLYEQGMDVPDEFEIVDFNGGLYAVATDIDQQTDMNAMAAAVDAFLSENGLVRDDSRYDLGNVVTSPTAHAILGYDQMDYYTPVKAK